MVRSMTGFATASLTITSQTGSNVTLNATIKSLNARYFEVNCKLPHQFSTLEHTLVSQLKATLYRGYISVTLHIDNQELFIGTIEPSMSVIKGYIDALNRVKQEYAITGQVTIAELVHLPDIFYTQQRTIDETLRDKVLTLFESLMQQVVKMQQDEGAALQQDLLRRIVNMGQALVSIKTASAQLLETQKEKTAAVLRDVAQDESKYAALHKDAAFAMLDKLDVHEEIVRFASHLDTLEKILHSAETELGKRIDFTLQELAREINTIGAKCSDATIGQLAINVKVELEKAREQAQNIV